MGSAGTGGMADPLKTSTLARQIG